MKILNAKIEEFGCLSGRTFDFADGLNLIEGDNESGKSTLVSFIKFIFYGLPRKTQENAAERERSLSWHSGIASGELTVETEKGKFTVSRRAVLHVGEKRETLSEECRITDVSTGLAVHKGENPGELFIGVPVAVYESTAFIGQLDVGNIKGDELGTALENMLVSADENLNYKKAVEKLEAARRSLRHKTGHGGTLAELEDEKANLESRLEKAKNDSIKIIAKTEQLDELRAARDEKRAEYDEADREFSAYSTAAIVRRFDVLHEKEKELAEAEESDRRFAVKCASDKGFLPDAQFAAKLDFAADTLDNARRGFDTAAERLGNAEEGLEKAKRELVTALDPADVRAAGGPDRMASEIETRKEKAASRSKAGTLLLIVGALLAGGSALTLAVLDGLAYLGLGLGALALVAFAVAIVSIKTSSKLKTEIKNICAGYHVDEADGSAALRDAALTALENERKLAELEGAVALASSALASRQADLDSASAAAESLVNKWGDRDGDAPDTLRRNASKAREILSELEKRMRAEAVIRRSVSDMKKELENYNEASLRSHLPEKMRSGYSESDYIDLDRRRKFAGGALRALSDKYTEADRELLTLENESEKPASLASKLDELDRRLKAETLKFDAVAAAIEALESASSNVRASVTPALRADAGKYISKITDEKYKVVGITEDYSMTAGTDVNSATRPIAQMSAGTRDAAYLSLRLSLLRLLYKDDPPPLTLDEALAEIDSKRAAGVLGIIGEYCDGGGQCILLSCHDRERRILGETGQEVNIIKM